MKKVKIFLASSAELDEDKDKFEIFISNKNKDFHKNRIFLELTTWKDFISSVRESRTQDEYNQYIHSSDICVFLFHTKLGRYTREEFDNAHNAFLKSNGKTPRIYTYFKKDSNESQEIIQLKEYIDSLDHFYDTYNSLDDLFVKFGRQLDKLENEGQIIKPERIDVAKIIKYAIYFFLLPILVLAGGGFSFYYFQPINMTVKITESNPIPTLPFNEGTISLIYGDKTETQIIHNEVLFKQIPSKYKRTIVKIQFYADGYSKVDTMFKTKEIVEIAIKRDNSLGVVKGVVLNENGIPIKSVNVSTKMLVTNTDENGRFTIDIPHAYQSEVVRLRVYKSGYKLWDNEVSPSENFENKIILQE